MASTPGVSSQIVFPMEILVHIMESSPDEETRARIAYTCHPLLAEFGKSYCKPRLAKLFIPIPMEGDPLNILEEYYLQFTRFFQDRLGIPHKKNVYAMKAEMEQKLPDALVQEVLDDIRDHIPEIVDIVTWHINVDSLITIQETREDLTEELQAHQVRLHRNGRALEFLLEAGKRFPPNTLELFTRYFCPSRVFQLLDLDPAQKVTLEDPQTIYLFDEEAIRILLAHTDESEQISNKWFYCLDRSDLSDGLKLKILERMGTLEGVRDLDECLESAVAANTLSPTVFDAMVTMEGLEIHQDDEYDIVLEMWVSLYLNKRISFDQLKEKLQIPRGSIPVLERYIRGYKPDSPLQLEFFEWIVKPFPPECLSLALLLSRYFSDSEVLIYKVLEHTGPKPFSIEELSEVFFTSASKIIERVLEHVDLSTINVHHLIAFGQNNSGLKDETLAEICRKIPMTMTFELLIQTIQELRDACQRNIARLDHVQHGPGEEAFYKRKLLKEFSSLSRLLRLAPIDFSFDRLLESSGLDVPDEIMSTLNRRLQPESKE